MYACRRGLDVIDEYRSMLGSSELRAQTTAHGAELANLGQRHALRLGRPRLMLAWSERWRAVALAVPSVRPPADEELQAELVAIRNISARLSVARTWVCKPVRSARSDNGWNVPYAPGQCVPWAPADATRCTGQQRFRHFGPPG